MAVSHDQNKHLMRLKTILGKDALIVESADINLAMSTGFSISLEVYSQKHHDVLPKQLIATPATVALVLEDDQLRHFNGYISSLTALGQSRSGELSHYAMVITSWLELFLDKRSDCRIFQDKTAENVIKEIFSHYTGCYYKFELRKPLPSRRYWVQYNETDLNFFNRICAQEGLAFYFEHENGKHTLKIIDSEHAPAQKQVILQSGTVAYDHLSSWYASGEFETGAYEVRSYNYMRPAAPQIAASITNAEVAQSPHVTTMQSYFYEDKHHNSDEGKHYITNKAHKSVERSHTRIGSGQHRSLSEADKISLSLTEGSGLFSGNFTDKGRNFTIASVNMVIDEGMGSLQTRVEAVPFGQIIFPEASKSEITGMQTAIVTGPKGEEIHTDQYGRIKVQFHWDRLGKQDENTTCWLRVMQSFAGPNFGVHFTPRIGQEVVVAFENGNPERPFVIGSMYHPEHVPPYAMQKGTRAGVRTRSTKGGGVQNCNELYFEDSKGAEEVYFQAEKDHNVLIKNDQQIHIGHNKSQQVIKNETNKVGENYTINVGKKLLIEAGQEIKLQVGGSTITMTSGKIDISSSVVDINGTIKLN